MRQGQLTPVSNSSGSQSVSPKTPNGRPGAGGRGDDYFTPKIASDYESTPPQSRRPGGYGGLRDLDPYEAELYPQNSPKKQAPSLMQRMNSITPGPFDSAARRKPSARNAFPRTDRNERDNDSSIYDTIRSNNGMDRTRDRSNQGRPTTSNSNTSFNSNGSAGDSAVPRVPRKNGYGGFGPPESSRDKPEPKPFGSSNRADTFPRPSEPVEAPLRTPSAPGPRPDRFRRPSNDMRNPMPPVKRRPSVGMGPDTSRTPPPRTSLIRPRTAGGSSNSIPTINLANEFGIGNPYHTPSASISSQASMYSRRGQDSAQTSYQTSPSRSFKSARDPTDLSSFDSLMSDLQSSMEEFRQTKADGLFPPKTRAGLPDRQPRSISRGENTIPSLRSKSQGPARPPPRSQSPLRSPLMPMPGRYGLGLRDNRPGEGYRSREQSPQSSGSPSRGRNRSGSRSRGYCRACTLPIMGPSIASADGRLSGRYHKSCFVCTTCSAPFTTAEFYVLNDLPYCEHHYHALNGSLCTSCGDGIEGEYAEDDEGKKHHARCWRCSDCGIMLRGIYFDVGGRNYCEKDAWRRVQQPWMANPPPLPGTPATTAAAALGNMLPPGAGGGLPGGPGPANRPFGLTGLPSGNRLANPRPRMEKRMTRLGML